MAITRPDEYKHNNSDRAIVDGDGVRGGRRVVADRAALYALASKADQLRQDVTIVRVRSDADNGGAPTDLLLIDASNIGNLGGWQVYSAGSNPGGGGGSGAPLLAYAFAFPVETDGAQSFPMPAGTVGIFSLQAQTEYNVLRPISPSHYQLSGGNLVISAAASLAQYETVEGTRYTGGSTGGSATSRDNNKVDAAVQVAVTDPGHTWNLGDLTAYATPALQTAATTGVQKGDYFDSLESGSTVDAYRYTYCLQNNGSLGWTRLYKLQ